MYRLHRAYVAALNRLAGTDLTPAEAHRELLAIEERTGMARPSYPTVRRFLLEERRLRQRTNEEWAPALEKLAKGRLPLP